MKSTNRPPGFTLRLTLKASNRANTRLAWASDGSFLASAAYDQSVRLWHPQNGEQIKQISSYSGSVFTVAVFPENDKVISASKNALKIWDLTGKSLSRTLRGHRDYVYSVALAPDGRFAFSGAYDQSVRVWDLSSDETIHELTGHRGRVGIVTSSPDGRYVISGAGDALVRVWDWAEEAAVYDLTGHRGEVLSLVMAPDGQTLASSAFSGDIRLWDLTTGKLIEAIKASKKPVTSLDFNSDGRFLAAKAADNTVSIWRCADWEPVAALSERHSSFAFAGLAFHPHAPILATLGERDKVIRIWDLDYDAWE